MNDTKNTNILFFGTSEFAVPILQKLIDEKYNIATVITQPDKPVGRKKILTPSPVKLLAEKHNLTVLQPDNLLSYGRDASRSCFNLIITASYGKIIPKEILDLPKYGALNVHPSLLPKYRGPSPIQHTILNGDEETGTTIMLMDEKMDHGEILAQEKLCIIEDDSSSGRLQKPTYLMLHNMLSQLSANLLIKTIPKWILKEIAPISQDDSKATYTKIITKEDGKIEWTKSAKVIERQIRAFSLWPICWTIVNIDGKEKRLKIIEAVLGADEQINIQTKKPGEFFKTTNKKMAAACGHNSCLEIQKLQLEGKQITSGDEFLNGHPNIQS